MQIDKKDAVHSNWGRNWLLMFILIPAALLSACSTRYVRPEARTISVSDFKCENEAVGRQAADILRLILVDKGYKVEPESYDLQDDVDAAYGNHSANMVVTGVITSFNCEADDRQVTQRLGWQAQPARGLSQCGPLRRINARWE